MFYVLMNKQQEKLATAATAITTTMTLKQHSKTQDSVFLMGISSAVSLFWQSSFLVGEIVPKIKEEIAT